MENITQITNSIIIFLAHFSFLILGISFLGHPLNFEPLLSSIKTVAQLGPAPTRPAGLKFGNFSVIIARVVKEDLFLDL